MEPERTLEIKDLSADDKIVIDDLVCIVIYVCPATAWLKHVVTGYIWELGKDEFANIGFIRWTNEPDSVIKTEKVGSYEQA